MIENSNYLLQNIENYKSELSIGYAPILMKYIALINEYMFQCEENIVTRKTEYYRYILKNGLNTLNHIFNIILLFTNNIDLTYFHCQKAYYYYVEFISQISDDNHSFLQLNSIDATLFVYKKTLFEINNEYKKEFSSNNNKIIDNINLFIRLYTKLIYTIIDTTTPGEQKIAILVNTNLQKITQRLVNLISKNDANYNSILKLALFFLENFIIQHEKIFIYFEIFLRKLRKTPMTENQLQQKLYCLDFHDKLDSLSPTKFINWLFLK